MTTLQKQSVEKKTVIITLSGQILLSGQQLLKNFKITKANLSYQYKAYPFNFANYENLKM